MLKAAFEATKLTPQIAASSKTVMDWQTQPSRFKHYPHFLFRYKLDPQKPVDHFLLQVRSITYTVTLNGAPYPKLNVPSAGNLHPIEVYVQLRKVAGKLSGIYHLDSEKGELVLIQEIEGDGVEYFYDYDLRQEGIFLFFSSVYFRSSWKYGLRAWRYLLLDMGHQIGALIAAAKLCDKELVFLENNTPNAVEDFLGFSKEEQLLFSASLSTPLKRKVKKPLQNCMIVQPTDYFVPHIQLELLLQNVIPYQHNKIFDTKNLKMPLENLPSAIYNRRSARKFSGRAINEFYLEQIMHFVSRIDDSLLAHVVLLHSHNTPLGIYQRESLLKKGSFVREIDHLLLSQTIAYTSAIVLFLSTSNMNSQSFYKAGIFAHELYLFCTIYNIGCSGVGAYYDDATQAFLQTDEDIIYCITIGQLEGN